VLVGREGGKVDRCGGVGRGGGGLRGGERGGGRDKGTNTQFSKDHLVHGRWNPSLRNRLLNKNQLPKKLEISGKRERENFNLKKNSSKRGGRLILVLEMGDAKTLR